MNKIIINPFEKLTEVQLLAIGLALTLLGCMLGYLCHTTFDGVIDVHPYPGITITQCVIDNAINTVSIFLPLYILGLIINKKTRFIDVLNTVLIARSPYYLLALGNAGSFFTNLNAKLGTGNPMDIKFAPLDLVIIVAFAMFSIAFLAWFVALLYNGFKTATNLKLTQHNVAFGFMIIVAEALSKLLMYLINY